LPRADALRGDQNKKYSSDGIAADLPSHKRAELAKELGQRTPASELHPKDISPSNCNYGLKCEMGLAKGHTRALRRNGNEELTLITSKNIGIVVKHDDAIEMGIPI
jgi:hypothetical protein